MENAEAGLRFQLVDRHPWAFHADGAWFLAIQTLLVTPLLLAALAVAAWRHRRDAQPLPRLFALVGALIVLGFFVLGFFADTERVSFHWPLAAGVAPGDLCLGHPRAGVDARLLRRGVGAVDPGTLRSGEVVSRQLRR